MSARDRAEKFHRAVSEGALAFASGAPIESCPYKSNTAWGLGGPWKMGWERARDAAQTVTQPSDADRAVS